MEHCENYPGVIVNPATQPLVVRALERYVEASEGGVIDAHTRWAYSEITTMKREAAAKGHDLTGAIVLHEDTVHYVSGQLKKQADEIYGDQTLYDVFSYTLYFGYFEARKYRKLAEELNRVSNDRRNVAL